MHWYAHAMRRYAVFSGRAGQAEFAAMFVAVFFMVLIAARLDSALFVKNDEGLGPLTTLVALAHLVPFLSVTARRFHDVGWSGWWGLVGLVPVSGLFTVLLAFVRGQPGPNRYGPDPLAGVAREADANWLAWVRRPAGSHAPATTPRAGLQPAVPGPEAPYRPAPRGSESDVVAELERLSRLEATGALTQSEFELLKARALARGEPR